MRKLEDITQYNAVFYSLGLITIFILGGLSAVGGIASLYLVFISISLGLYLLLASLISAYGIICYLSAYKVIKKKTIEYKNKRKLVSVISVSALILLAYTFPFIENGELDLTSKGLILTIVIWLIISAHTVYLLLRIPSVTNVPSKVIISTNEKPESNNKNNHVYRILTCYIMLCFFVGHLYIYTDHMGGISWLIFLITIFVCAPIMIKQFLKFRENVSKPIMAYTLTGIYPLIIIGAIIGAS